MKNFFLLLAGVLLINKLYAQNYTGPIPFSTSPYAQNGNFVVAQKTFVNPVNPGQLCTIFHPSDTSQSYPTIFFSHGFGGFLPVLHQALFQFLVSRGHTVVHVPYPVTTDVYGHYNVLRTGFMKAARDFSQYCDTTKVGFLGYSFGGGASPSIASEMIRNFGWGSQGRFIASVAPFYTLDMTPAQLQAIPQDTRFLTFIMQDDDVCDHRMAMDIFDNIPTPISEKDIVYVVPSLVSGYDYEADHNCFTNAFTSNYDAIDVSVFQRLLGALTAYVFDGEAAAYDVCLGSGSAAQITMPSPMANLSVTDAPFPLRPASQFQFPCDSNVNPRASYCQPLSIRKIENEEYKNILSSLYFDINSSSLEFEITPALEKQEAMILDAMGRVLIKFKLNTGQNSIPIQFPNQVLFLKIANRAFPFVGR